jgi:alkanesulfonate monooxygenase SsuD/methylene tetrahydromethanopterin reductase-like flavin-dependent oxidoreductase (luciferase family)
LSNPKIAVAAWVVCAPTRAEARDLTASFLMMMTLLYRGQLIPVPSVAKAKKFLCTECGLPMARRLIVGGPDEVRASIEALAAEYKAEEVLLVNILYDHAARRRSYELVARAFDLGRPADRNGVARTDTQGVLQ